MPYYLSFQYSAIQKTVLRHDRLWSIAGISQGLARLNEVTLPRIVEDFGGEVLVAGGGKFTARFGADGGAGVAASPAAGGTLATGTFVAPGTTSHNAGKASIDPLTAENNAVQALREIRKAVATAFPMLEFQMVAAPCEAKSFRDLWYDPVNSPKNELGEQKQRFRGYGVSFNPHLSLCPECGDYPADRDKIGKGSRSGEALCAACHAAQEEAWRFTGTRRPSENGPSIERVYARFYRALHGGPEECGKIPINFEDLAKWRGNKDDIKPRMAVWFSDLNNMNSKVPLWLQQGDEEIEKVFQTVTEINVNIIVESLFKTFGKHAGREYLPFRLIVAGGDDLIIAMDEPFILPFCRNYSQTMTERMSAPVKEGDKTPETTDYLSSTWLKEKNKQLCKENPLWAKHHKPDDEPTPYCFGGSFIVTSTHTPFRRIHEVGEELMGEAKRKTKRAGNSVNWVIMAAEKEPLTARLLTFEKPLLIEKGQDGRLSMNDFLNMVDDYKSGISGTQRQRMVGAMIDCGKDHPAFEEWMIRHAARETDKIYSALLMDKRLRKDDKKLSLERLATLLELMGIEALPKGGNK